MVLALIFPIEFCKWDRTKYFTNFETLIDIKLLGILWSKETNQNTVYITIMYVWRSTYVKAKIFLQNSKPKKNQFISQIDREKRTSQEKG